MIAHREGVSPHSVDLSVLLDYDGYEFVFERGYVARFRFARDEAAEAVHPYRYSLTLHDPHGRRILGFDNAHTVEKRIGRFGRRTRSMDHWHRDANDKGVPYVFVSPEKLLEDFFANVMAELERRGVPIEASDVRRTRR